MLAWITWALVLFRMDPGEAGLIGFLLFYVTLFASLVGTLAVGGVLYRVLKLKRHHLIIREVRIAFRHGIILSLAGVVSLALSAQNLLTWWNLFGVFFIIGLIEYLFVLMEESRRV